MPGQLSALILLEDNSITQLHGDWRNRAGEATSPSDGRRPSLRFRLAMLEWRRQTTSNNMVTEGRLSQFVSAAAATVDDREVQVLHSTTSELSVRRAPPDLVTRG